MSSIYEDQFVVPNKYNNKLIHPMQNLLIHMRMIDEINTIEQIINTYDDKQLQYSMYFFEILYNKNYFSIPVNLYGNIIKISKKLLLNNNNDHIYALLISSMLKTCNYNDYFSDLKYFFWYLVLNLNINYIMSHCKVVKYYNFFSEIYYKCVNNLERKKMLDIMSFVFNNIDKNDNFDNKEYLMTNIVWRNLLENKMEKWKVNNISDDSLKICYMSGNHNVKDMFIQKQNEFTNTVKNILELGFTVDPLLQFSSRYDYIYNREL